MSHPSFLVPQLESIPEDLRAIDQWVCWSAKPDPRGGKPRKVPIDPATGDHAKVDQPATWSDFERACRRFESGGMTGIGFVLTQEAGLAGVDLDHCIDQDTGELEARAQQVIDQLDSYTELSPSGTGVHVLVRGQLPKGGRRKGKIEMYDDARYLTVTGHLLHGGTAIVDRGEELLRLHNSVFGEPVGEPGGNSSPEFAFASDQELLDRAMKARNGDKFTKLWNGDHSTYESQSEADLALCGMLAFWTGGDRAQIDSLFRRSGLFRPKWDEKHYSDGRTYGVATIRLAVDGRTEFYSQAGAASTGRPQIIVQGGMLPEVVDAAERALLGDGGDQIYRRGTLLVRPVRAEAPTVHEGTSMSAPLLIRPVEAPYLVERFTRAAVWERYSDKENKRIDCPSLVAKTYMAREGMWLVPPLRAVITAPTLRPDGSVLNRPGYDEGTGLLFDPGNVTFARVPESPKRQEAIEALERLKKILEGFPFVKGSDRAAALAAILTATVRPSIRTAPLFAFRAPKMASGKSLLADVVALIATGRPAAVMSHGNDEDEQRKRILALLLEGEPVACIDNVEDGLGGAPLCSVLTQVFWKDRVLGASKTATVPTNVTWLATGNNLHFIGDISTRVIPCDLDPGCERPEEREFEVDLHEYLPLHRHELVPAALTVLRAYEVAGRPKQELPVFGRFEEWGRRVRSALVWCGEEDPCLGRFRIESFDPEREQIRAVLEPWYRLVGATEMTVADIIRAARESDDQGLFTTLTDVARVRGGEPDPRRLGHWLNKRERRVEGGFRVDRVGERQGSVLWRVTKGGEP